MFTVYLVGSISGQSYDEVVTSITYRAKKLANAGYFVIHPMLGKEYLRNELEFKAKDFRHPVSTNHAIYNRDRWCVEQADIILADLTNSNGRVSIGSMFELAWAEDSKKHIILVMDKENVHQHAFVLEAADIIFETVDEALDYLTTFIEGI